MKQLTYAETLGLLTEIVEEKGRDFVYVAPPRPGDDGRPVGDCAYAAEAPDGSITPSCGVGQVVFRIDPELLPVIHNFDAGVGDRFVGVNARALIEGALVERIEFDAESVNLLESFQVNQDIGIEYGHCLDSAVEYVRNGGQVSA